MRRKLLTGVIGLVGVLVGCRDSAVGPEVDVQAARGRQEPAVQPPGHAAVDRFAVSLDVQGSFRPGNPLNITFSIAANYNTPRALVVLRMPEVVQAQSTSWANARMRPGMRIPPVLDAEEELVAGGRIQRRASINIPRAGYYRIVVAAEAPDESIVLSSGEYVQNAAYTEVWVLIDENGGGVTSTYDPSVFADSVVPLPGPREARRRKGDKVDATVSMSTLSTLTPGMVTGYAMYHHPLTGEVLPVEGLTMQSWLYDSYEGQDYDAYSMYSGPDGYFEFYCPTEERHQLNIEAQFRSSAITKYPAAGSYQFWWWDCVDGADASFNFIPHEAHAFLTFNRVALASRSLFGASRSAVNLRFSTSGSSYYSRSSAWGPWGDVDHIQMNTNSVFGAWGSFVQAHEYGHAAHHRALGDFPSLPSSCESHSFTSLEAPSCAFVEGFADYHAVATLGSETGQLANLENNSYYVSGVDGSRLEHSVAAFLWDLTDPANEPHDAIQYPGSYITAIFKTCDVAGQSTGYFDRSSIEHVIYCLERNVDVSVRPLFTGRLFNIVFQRESAIEPPTWNLAAIRALWRRNLYGL